MVRAGESAQATLRPEASRRVADKKFWILGGALNSAMLLDTKSTFDVTKVCVDCYEANPSSRRSCVAARCRPTSPASCSTQES